MKSSPEDTQAGQRGLKECVPQMHAYEQCMTKKDVKDKTESKLFRVRDCGLHSVEGLAILSQKGMGYALFVLRQCVASRKAVVSAH